MDLKKLRTKINAADDEIVRLIARRQSYMPRVARIKKKLGMPILQPKREIELLKAKKALAKKLGVSEKLIQAVFKLIMKDSRRVQRDI